MHTHIVEMVIKKKETHFRGLHNYLMQEHIPFSRESVQEYVRIHASDRARAKLFENAKNLMDYESYNSSPFELIDEHYHFQYPIMRPLAVDWGFADHDQSNTGNYNLSYRKNIAQLHGFGQEHPKPFSFSK